MGFDTILWVAAVVLFVIAEAVTTALVSIWFAVGAAAALMVSLFTSSLGAQFVVFAVVSAVTLGIMLPRLAKRRKENAPPVTNGARLSIGKRGVVLQAVLPGEVGRVRVDGLDWQAKADAALPQGARCEVTDVDGAVLIVRPAPVEETV